MLYVVQEESETAMTLEFSFYLSKMCLYDPKSEINAKNASPARANERGISLFQIE